MFWVSFRFLVLYQTRRKMLQRWNEKNTVSEERKKEKNVRKEITEQQCLNSVSTRQAAIVVSKRTKRERRHRQRPQKQNFESIFLNNKKKIIRPCHRCRVELSMKQWEKCNNALDYVRSFECEIRALLKCDRDTRKL